MSAFSIALETGIRTRRMTIAPMADQLHVHSADDKQGQQA